MGESTKMLSISNFQKNLALKISSIALIGILFASSFDVQSYAQVMQENDCAAPLTTTIDANYQGPVSIDAYWVDQGVVDTSASATNPIKKEIGPGEGSSVFAVVLNNRGNNPLNSVTAFLNLPSGFSPTGSSKIPQLLQQYNPASRVASNYALASYYGQVPAGGTFILFFNVNVLPTAKVGTFSTTMAVNYKIGVGAPGLNVQSCTSALLQVPLVLPGKVVLDLASDHNYIEPAKSDPLTLTIKNKGSANATGVVATITNLGNNKGGSSGSGGSLVLQSGTTNIINLGNNTFNLGNIPAGASANITTTVFPSSAAGGSTQEVDVQLTYENAWGKSMTSVLSTGAVISPLPPESLSLTYVGNGSSPIITSGNLSNLNFTVTNNGTTEASNIVVSLVPQSTSVSIVGQSTWTIPKLEPGEQQSLSTQVFAANSLIDTPTSFTLTANYVAHGQTQTNSLTLGAFVVGDVKLEIYGLAVNYVGNTPQIAGSLLNQGSTTGLYGTIQLAPSPLFDAIRQARMANANSSSYNSSSFQQADAQSTSDQSNGRGGFGSGQGGFNGGGRGGFGGGQGGFNGSRGAMNTQQFLGDLTADSPIPFSIPLNGLNLLQPGVYPISFKVVYADDLKNFHTITLTQNIMIARTQPTHVHEQSSITDQILNNPLILAAIGVSVAGAIAAGIIIRKKKTRKKLKMLTGNDTDIVSVLENVDKKQNEPT